MALLDEIMRAQNGGSVRNLAQSFGLNEEQVQSALATLVPALGQGLQNNAAAPGGLDSLAAALGGGNHERYVDDPAAIGEPATVTDGNGILGHVFGSKDTSRAVADRAAKRTGISSVILKKMLPVVAALVMGQLSRKARGGRQGAPSSGGLGGILGSLLGGGGGSIADDLLGMAAGRLGGR